ncbi:MAG TPA: ABC transporter permease [Anaerolineae bacterium]|nr:ABC transporter permease [Anaerolineae bacterium]HQI87316.1 ABC transporter permease [Anaerolineae bacterium]
MWKYLLRRSLYALFTVWVISLLAFAIIQLPPGDYVTDLLKQLRAQAGNVPPEWEERMRQIYGFDDPFIIQYFKWMRNIILHGQFGYSFFYKRDAGEMIVERLPMSFALSLFSTFFVWIVALPIGFYSAVRRYSIVDYAASFMGFFGMAIPNFLLALIVLFVTYRYMGGALIGLFSKNFAEAPWSWAKFVDLLKHIWVPMVIIGVGSTAGLIRTMRANLLDELNKPYVETARAKGLSEMRLLIKYPLRHALNPFVSTLGWMLPGLVSGEVIVSMVLNLPTSGPVLYQALVQQDQYVAAGFILVLSTLTVIGTFISDLLLAWVDPRIRLQ